jgi:lipopolysaccharide transport system ATP-binding protein
LLKLLSHITDPTEGRAEIRGRVASLLDVGAGFHPELTGRENIKMNGAILGMTRAEIKARFDDIVAFAETGRFLDTPVKRYSSGMYVRLAFAVAAHLDPEILIVDEVLAVGDAEFQKKCLGKMEQVATGGRTVLFVSHNMGAIRSLCTRCALLDGGRLLRVGDVDSVVDHYIEMGGTSGVVFALRERDGQLSTTGVSVTEGRIVAVEQDEASLTSVRVELDCLACKEILFNVEWRIVTMTGQPVVFGGPELFRREQLRSRVGAFALDVNVLRVPLAAGEYRLELALTQAFRMILDTLHLEFGVEVCDPGRVGFDFHYGSNWAATFAEDDVVMTHRVPTASTDPSPPAQQ